MKPNFSRDRGIVSQPSYGILQMPGSFKQKTTQVNLVVFYFQALRLIAEKEELSKSLFLTDFQDFKSP